MFSPTKAELRKAQGLATAARADAQMKTNIAEAKKKYVKSLPVECNNWSKCIIFSAVNIYFPK